MVTLSVWRHDTTLHDPPTKASPNSHSESLLHRWGGGGNITCYGVGLSEFSTIKNLSIENHLVNNMGRTRV